MSRREFLRNISATTMTGGLLGANRLANANQTNEPTIGYFQAPEDPLVSRLDRPWEMTEQEWTKIIGHVRPGRPLKPKRWPNDSQFAVALSFDCDHEAGALASGNFAPGRLAWGERGRRVGVPRILEVLRRHDVPATFYIPAVVALIDPEETRRIVG
ncbi:uncharacterized protein METZ01_LOCUS337039, partial [marine metagenome]